MESSLTKLNADLNVIAKLDDQPNDVGGMTAQALKAEFDKAALIIQEYINSTLVPQIESALGSGTVALINGNQLVDGSIQAAKLAALSIVADKIANGAVGTAKIADSAVTANKIAAQAVNLKTKVDGVLPVENGGTGVQSIAKLKEAFGTIPVSLGGTGSTTAAGARTALGITLANLGITYGAEGQRPANPQEGQIYLVKVE